MRTIIAAAAVTLAGLSLAQAAEEIVTIDGADRPIAATITLPEGEGPFPFVVMYHGTGSNRHEAGNGYDMLAPVLAAAGIASGRFDFAGNGDSTVDYTQYTPASGVQDGRDVIAYMQGLDTIDDDRLGLFGLEPGRHDRSAHRQPDSAGQERRHLGWCTRHVDLHGRPV